MVKRKDLTEDEIRAMVRDRILEEGSGASAGEAHATRNAPPEPSYDFIVRCLRANELGDGILFAYLHRDRHVYVGQADEWMWWSGHHWSVDLVDKAHRASIAVEDVALAYEKAAVKATKDAENARDSSDKEAARRLDRQAEEMRKRAFRLRSQGGRGRCLDFAKANHEYPMAIRGDEIDCEPWLLPVANGVIDLRTGEIEPGKPEDYLMKSSPVAWEGIDTPCPEWDRFLLEIMDGDAEMVAFLQRAFGYGITGLSREHIFLLLHGRGRNGKGILTEIIQETLGGGDATSTLAGPVQSEMLLDQGKRNAAGPSPDIMSLRGMRLAFASETDEGQKFSSARVKWLSGGDTLTGRYPHDKRNVSFTPTHLLVLLTNHRPHAPAADFAFWERLLLVDFPLSFVDRQPQKPTERPMDKELKDRLRGELPGILAWLVRGCLAWQMAGGLKPPEKVRQATAEYQRDEDTMADFVEDVCLIAPSESDPSLVRTRATDLFDAFGLWYRINVTSNPKKQMSQKRFGKLMAEKFDRERKGGVYYYYGVELDEASVADLREKDGQSQEGRL